MPGPGSGRLAGLGRAHRLARGRHQAVQLAGLGRADQRVDERRQLVPGRDGDAGLAPLELDRLGAVVDATSRCCRRRRRATRAAPAAASRPGGARRPCRSSAGRFGRRTAFCSSFFCSSRRSASLARRLATGSWERAGTAGEREVLEDRHDLSPWLVEIGLYSVCRN